MVREGSADGVANGDGESQRRSLHHPWASVVRGENSSPTASSPVEEDNSLIESWGESSDSNVGDPRRPAWNRPRNDPIPAVMGGTGSWPELSLSTRPPVSRSLSDTSAPAVVSDGSPQQALIISQSSHRSASSSSVNGNHGNSTGNNPNPARPRSRNRGSGGGGGSSSGTEPSQSTFNQPSLPRPVGGFRASHSHSGNDHSSQRSNSRRSNYGPRPRGDGQHHNHGGSRDQDHRDVNHLPHYVPPHMGYMPPPLPPGASTYMAPLPMRVFPGQMGFDMVPPFFYFPQMPPESFRAMPIVSPPRPMVFPPANENPLINMIVNQIDFYFSDDNLVKDSFLRSNMDDHGWVPVSLIASFRRVQLLTNDIPLILESLRYSMVVEVQGDKVRRRNEWNKWVLSTGVVNSYSGSRTSSSAPENDLATSLQEVSLDDALVHMNGNVDARESCTEMAAGQLSEESTRQSGSANGDNADEVHLRSS